ncbi:methylated-DNA--[protein]-cysteine S-methyltransferase [Jatrophihabitans sp. GAS493]|uniref:methylated-DNA--[protein]-cysteine S-methyltransferase n=1 Tax=Jatrophihabitans sp. GAS493 TaxID=1907575 RepID=UPI002739B9E8|nr:methylated-DNA--[protein]-cysteine S-methyltransferase [Jatrophihabitans sp. GAS493]
MSNSIHPENYRGDDESQPRVRYTHIPSPVGPLLVKRDRIGITGLYFSTGRHPEWVSSTDADATVDDGAFDDVRAQLEEYFAGRRTRFELELNPAGTDFQRRVWLALREIPYGKTKTYGEQAEAIGSPKAVRAVGLANGRNPISIIVPCHRVIGANGSLTGFGGGLEAKRWLLDHEASAERLL